MTLFLVDTASLIEIERRRPDGLEFLRRIEDGIDELATCDVVVAEYYSGRTRGERPVIDRLLDSWAFIATTFAIAATAGNLRHSLARRGVQVSMTDALIAAAAASAGATIVTENVRDFALAGVTVLTLAEASASP